MRTSQNLLFLSSFLNIIFLYPGIGLNSCNSLNICFIAFTSTVINLTYSHLLSYHHPALTNASRKPALCWPLIKVCLLSYSHLLSYHHPTLTNASRKPAPCWPLIKVCLLSFLREKKLGFVYQLSHTRFLKFHQLALFFWACRHKKTKEICLF